MLRHKATLPLSNEPSHDYVCLTGPELNAVPVGLCRVRYSAIGLFLGRKSKISHGQNVIIFQFYIRMANFRHLDSIMKKQVQKVADLHIEGDL